MYQILYSLKLAITNSISLNEYIDANINASTLFFRMSLRTLITSKCHTQPSIIINTYINPYKIHATVDQLICNIKIYGERISDELKIWI